MSVTQVSQGKWTKQITLNNNNINIRNIIFIIPNPLLKLLASKVIIV